MPNSFRDPPSGTEGEGAPNSISSPPGFRALKKIKGHG